MRFDIIIDCLLLVMTATVALAVLSLPFIVYYDYKDKKETVFECVNLGQGYIKCYNTVFNKGDVTRYEK